MKRIACVPMLQEIWALQLQISHLTPLFDAIVVVEANKTFAGQNKFMYFEHYVNELNAPPDFLRYVRVEDLPEVMKEVYVGSAGRTAPENRWPLERHMRNAAARALSEEDDDTIVFMLDIDEFVSHEAIEAASKGIGIRDVFSFSLIDYRGNISSRGRQGECFLGGYATMMSTIRKNDIHFMRRFVVDEKGAMPSNFRRALTEAERGRPLKDFFDRDLVKTVINDAGWHLSSMHGRFRDYLNAKVQNFSHSESWKGGERIDTTADQYAPLSKYVLENFSRYDQASIDVDIPPFIREFSATFPILLEFQRDAVNQVPIASHGAPDDSK